LTTRKETPEALAAAKKEARSRSMAPASDPPAKGPRFGFVLLMLAVAGAAIWFLVAKQSTVAEQEDPDAPDERASQPRVLEVPPVETPPAPAATATSTVPVLEASALPLASGVAAPVAPAQPSDAAKVGEGTEGETPRASAGSEEGTRIVTVHLTPPDARLFHKGRSVGKSPVRIELAPGEKKRSFEVGRPGYVTRRLVIDGSQPELWVGLRPESK
jgi:hypothetical protein